MSEKKRALLSVWDKRGLVALARELSALGFDLVSTGGTARALREAGLPVTAVAEITGFPEILGGRVKTLHPLLHGGILADLHDPAHCRELAERGIVPVHMVVVNLYPFAETVARPGVSHAEAVENIDIGGPTMVRAAAKNHAHVAVVVNPQRYDAVISELRKEGALSGQTRESLAAEAFAHTAAYDAAVAAYFQGQRADRGALFPPDLTLNLHKKMDLRYGENPHQEAALYLSSGPGTGLGAMKQHQGKALSFNNLNDLHAARELVAEFSLPAAVAVKHTNPCGVGLGPDMAAAYRLAHDADPVAIFGGVVAFNGAVDGAVARELKKIFLEVVVAPHFTGEALAVLAGQEGLRLVEIALPAKEAYPVEYDIKTVAGGLLLQVPDRQAVDLATAQVVTEREPTEEEWEALALAGKVVKHVRSNAIVIASPHQTLGVGAGQMSRIGAARIALAQAGEGARGAALGSDAFFPFPDTVEEAAAAGVKAIIQPGGSLKDDLSIEACNRLGLTMVFTGQRHFKH